MNTLYNVINQLKDTTMFRRFYNSMTRAKKVYERV